MKSLIKTFFYKNNSISKTAIFLSLATFILLILWPFQALFVGVNFFGWWVIPEFSASAATSVLGTLAALYAVNHGWTNREGGITTEELAEMRTKMEETMNIVKGRTDNDR